VLLTIFFVFVVRILQSVAVVLAVVFDLCLCFCLSVLCHIVDPALSVAFSVDVAFSTVTCDCAVFP
jgi:hypothetical protein